MIGFHRRDSALCCDGVSLDALARSEGTPLYVYSGGLLRARIGELRAGLSGTTGAIHYALKANSTLALVRLVREEGCGVDANSIGEVEVALRAGVPPGDIVFTGVGKTPDELARAVALPLKCINAESAGELARIDDLSRARGARVRVAVRVNPDVDARTHPKISTGRRVDKFGVPLDEAAAVCREASLRAGLALVGLHVHVGSQITDLGPLRQAATAVAALAAELRAAGLAIEHLDLGGGLGISYDGRPVPSLGEYASVARAAVAGTGLTLIVEPGRALTGPAGVLLARVVDIKPQSPDRLFVVLDAGMTELLRPALYGAYHRIEPVTRSTGPVVTCDVVGPLCESSDVVGAGRDLPRPQVGDVLAILDAGAYGFAMASNYNRRPMPAEVLVDGGSSRVVRRRQTVDDLLALET